VQMIDCQPDGSERPGVLFAAEAASRWRNNDPNPVYGELQHLSDIALHVMRLVGATHHGDPALFIQVTQQTLPLQVGVFQKSGLVAGFQHQIRGGKSSLQIAMFDLVRGKHVGLSRDRESSRPQGLFHLKCARERFEICLDGLESCLSLVCAFGHDQGDGSPQHPQGRSHGRQDRLFNAVIGKAIDPRNVRPGKDPPDTRQT
jgi:hypothetical protein